MNSLMKDFYPIFEMYQALRSQFMVLLTDDDLACNVGGENMSLGALCVEIGEIEASYIASFKTFKQDFSYRQEEPGLDRSVADLKTWFRDLDLEL